MGGIWGRFGAVGLGGLNSLKLPQLLLCFSLQHGKESYRCRAPALRHKLICKMLRHAFVYRPCISSLKLFSLLEDIAET